MDRLPNETPRALVVICRAGRDRRALFAQGDLDSRRLGPCCLVHAFTSREFVAPAFSVRAAGRAGALGAFGGWRAIPGELDGREPGLGDLHLAVGYRATGRSGEWANYRPDPRPAFLACVPAGARHDRSAGRHQSRPLDREAQLRPDRLHDLGRPGIHHPGSGDFHADRK